MDMKNYININKTGLLVIFFIYIIQLIFAEGTKQIQPNTTDTYYLLINRANSGTGLNIPFAMYTPNAIPYPNGTNDVDYRLNIRICNPGERVRFGFRGNQSNTFFRIKNQAGVVVFGPMLMPSAAGEAFINTYDEAVAGPRSIVGATGYNDTGFVAPTAGDYYIEFNRGNSTTYAANEISVRFFDVTVVRTNGIVAEGRLWSKAWQLTDANSVFSGQFFIYADDGIVTKWSGNGIEPHAFSVSCNATGCLDTGDPVADRKSRPDRFVYPQYKIFINDPDSLCYPTGTYGKLLADPQPIGCGSNICVNVTVDKPGNIIVTLDLNGVPGYQIATIDRQISFTAVAGLNCVPWDGLNGLGAPVLNGTQFPVQVDFLNGITHLPLYDCEDNRNGLLVTLVRPRGTVTQPKIFWDDSNITPGTAVDGKVNLTGCALATGCHRWTGRGSNNCPPCSETINSWWYANITTSNPVTYIHNSVNVDANKLKSGFGSANNDNHCGNGTPYQLNGFMKGAASIRWSTTGTGTFTSTTDTNARYTPSAADLSAGSVKILLESIGNGLCIASKDSMVLSFTTVPSANAGRDTSVCRNNTALAIRGTISVATAATWSGGAGSFAPNRNSLTPTYTPSSAELTAGTPITLTLTTTTGNGVCPAAVDQMRISIIQTPTVNAGADRTVCGNNANTVLAGVTSTGSAVWSGGSGTFTANVNTLNATYSPTAAEIAATNVVLTLTTTNNGLCRAVSDQMRIRFTAAPTISAGADRTVCATSPAASLSRTMTVATAATWSGGGGMFTPSVTNANPTYTPTAVEIAAGIARVIVTTTAGLGTCNAVRDTVLINITGRPTANAGADRTICFNRPTVSLSGSVTNATGGRWLGAGTFSPNNTSLNTTYAPTAAEITARLSILVLETTGIGTCTRALDTVLVVVANTPSVNAGVDGSVCSNNRTLSLSTATGTFETYKWTTNGTGKFNPGGDSSFTLRPIYLPSAADTALGTVTLTLQGRSTSCNPINDQMNITFTSSPIVTSSSSVSICKNNAIASVNGSSSTGSGVWSGGSGSFSPNAITASPTYTPSAAEITSGSIVQLTYTSANNGNCLAKFSKTNILFTNSPSVNAGVDQTLCANKSLTTLAGVSSTNAGSWSGGVGSFTPNALSLNATYAPSKADSTAGFVVLTLTSSSNGNCNAVNDQVRINLTPAPTISAGTDLNICADVPVATLSGTVVGSTSVIWTGGLGSFSPNNTNQSPTYTASSLESSRGKAMLNVTSSGNNNCNPVSDSVIINIAPAPTADAGPDQTICASATTVSLSGSFANAGGVLWTSNGTGTFSNTSALSPTYTPSAADRTTGAVTITLSTTGNNRCQAVSDVMRIFFVSSPTVNAGVDQIVCQNDFPVNLSGSGSPATWSGGLGTFVPNNTTQNAKYTPSAAEITAGSVTLTLTTNPIAFCSSVSDQVVITLKSAPTANAGADQAVCGNSSTFNISGTVTNATGGSWTTLGSGTFIPNSNALVGSYQPSSSDISNGSTTLILSTTGNAGCSAVKDTVRITIAPVVSVNAGPDQSFCRNNVNLNLLGTVVNTSGGTWSGGTGTFSPNNSTLNAKYIPSAAELALGSVNLQLSTIASNVCPSLTDFVRFTFTAEPTVNAGADKTICADKDTVNLSGIINSIPTGVSWSTSGSGTFSPSSAALKTSYFLSTSEKNAGIVTLTLMTTGNGACLPATDQMVLNITPKPTINIGKDTSICADRSSISLLARFTVASNVVWKTSNNGTYNDTSLTAPLYTFSANEKAAEIVTLTATTKGNGTCQAVSDQILINLTPAPTVNAGFDQITCENVANINLLGSVTVASGGIWTTSGTGTFSNNNLLATTYSPSALDISNGKVKLALRTTGNGTCNSVIDTLQVQIDPKPTASAGSNVSICADSIGIAINGIVGVATGGKWTSSGGGNFFPNNTTLNANYVPSQADRTAGSVNIILTTTGNGSCNADISQFTLTIVPTPTTNAGPDQTICADKDTIYLSGSQANATGAAWYFTGSGLLAPSNTSLTPYYLISPTDRAAGKVVFGLNTTGNGICKAANDLIIATIAPKPVVNAGSDLFICADAGVIPLSGLVLNAGGGQWSTSGGGFFTPNDNALSSTYVISENDLTTGNFNLVLKSTNNGSCSEISDTIDIKITTAPTIDLPNDIESCVNTNNISLSVNLTVASGVNWSTSGSGLFSPNNTSTIVSYQPSALDRTNGVVKIKATTTGNGTCKSKTDSLNITLKNLPQVDAGADFITCADQNVVFLSGTVTNAKGIKWETSGIGTFQPSDTAINAVYNFSAADSLFGNVIIQATSTGNGPCPQATDSKNVTFTPIPTVSAGPDITTCPTADSIQLNGVVTVAAGGFWSSNGSGTFLPNDFDLNAIYQPSPKDIANGVVTLTLISQDNGFCDFYSDALQIFFQPSPNIDAGTNKTICKTDFPISLEGSGPSGQWINGLGTFTPNNKALNATYIPSASEISAGFVKLVVLSTKTGSCAQSQDSVTFSFIDGPVIDAGIDTSICANGNGLTLYASSNGLSSGVQWSTASGTGTFLPNANSLNPTFIPSDFQKTNGRATLTLTSTGNGVCAEVKDVVILNITPSPTVNIGPNLTLCTDLPSVQFQSSYTIAKNLLWTSLGDGVFDNDILDNPTYSFGNNDFVNKKVKIIATTQGVGLCNSLSDTLEITFIEKPSISAGNDTVICASNTELDLRGKITNAAGGEWISSSGGSFAPNQFLVNSTYIPTALDRTNQTVSLYFKTIGVGSCIPLVDTVLVTINPLPTVDAGKDTTLCASPNPIDIFGSASTASVWRSPGRGIFGDSVSFTTDYLASNQDKLSGGVTITLNTTGNGACNSQIDYKTIVLIAAPIALVNAGFDQELCRDQTQAQLAGFIANAAGGIWTKFIGTGTLDDPTKVEALYTLSAQDVLGDSVKLRLTSTGNGICQAVFDDVVVRFTDTVTVAGITDNTFCADTTFQITGAVINNAGGGTWSTGGTGFFVPNANVLNAMYVPSSQDKSAGFVGLTLTSTDNGTCNAQDKNIKLTILSQPTINAGVDRSICLDATQIPIVASFGGAGGVTWTSSGTGNFNPNNTSAIYSPTTGDKNNVQINFFAQTIPNNSCKPVKDKFILNFTPRPTVNAGADVTSCGNLSQINLGGSVTIAAGGFWSTNGSGAFTPSSTALNAKYQPSLSDVSLGSVNLVLQTTGNGSCNARRDTIVALLQQIPKAEAGPAQSCAYANGVQLNGSFINATGGEWSTSGSGIFATNFAQFDARYFPSSNDNVLKVINLTYTTTGNGVCSPSVSSTTLTINELPVANSGEDQSVCINGTAQLVAKVSDDIASYSWKSLTGIDQSNSSVLTTIPITDATDYELTVTNNFGCIDRDTITVNKVDSVKFVLPPHFCLVPNLSIAPLILNGTVTAQYQWYRNNLAMNGQNDSTIIISQPGNYKIAYTVGNCQYSTVSNITEPPVLVHNDKISCINNSLDISSRSITSKAIFVWQTAGSPTGNPFTLAPVIADTNLYYVKGTDSLGCTSTDSIRVIGIEKPILTLGNDSACVGGSFVLVATPSNINKLKDYDPIYSWFKDGVYFSDNDTITSTTTSLFVATVSIDECITTDTAALKINSLPIDLLQPIIRYCSDTLTAIRIDAGQGSSLASDSIGMKYIWSTGETTRRISVNGGGDFKVTITNKSNCSFTDSVSILDRCPPKVFVPTAFTPGRNVISGNLGDDKLYVKGKHDVNYKFTIFSRWGEIIFYTEDRNESWDGTYKGEPVPIGLYPFMVSYEGIHEEFKGPYSKRGSITVIR